MLGQVSKEAKLKHFSSLLRKTHFLWFVTLLNNECRRASGRQNFRGEIARRFYQRRAVKRENLGFALCLHASCVRADSFSSQGNQHAL